MAHRLGRGGPAVESGELLWGLSPRTHVIWAAPRLGSARHKKVHTHLDPRLVARLDALTGGAAAANERVPVLVTLDGDVGALDAAVAAAPGQCATSTTIRVGAVRRKTRKPVLRRSPSP